MSEPTIFISAGEASGELYGAMLVEELRNQLAAEGPPPQLMCGMGGQRMVNAGLRQIVRSEDMAVMGITEVIQHLPRIYREYQKLKSAIRTHRPEIAVTHRLSRHSLQTRPGIPPPQDPRHFFRKSSNLGVEEETYQTCAKVRRQDARHLPLRTGLLSRTRRDRRIASVTLWPRSAAAFHHP